MGKRSIEAAAANKKSRAAIVAAVTAVLRDVVARHLLIPGVNELSQPALVGLCKDAVAALALPSRRAPTTASPLLSAPKDITSYRNMAGSGDGRALIAEFYLTVQESVRKNALHRVNPVNTTTCPIPARRCDAADRPTLRFTPSQAARWVAAGGDPRLSLQFTHIVAIAQGRLPSNKHDDMSHLCHNKLCVLHTVWESKADNAERNNCAAAKSCLGNHGGVPCAFQPAGDAPAALPDLW